MLPEFIETERLRLAPRTPEYVDPLAVYDYCKTDAPHIDEITEHVPWRPHPQPKESLEFLERGAKKRADHETAVYVVRPKDGEGGAGEVAGFAGLNFDWEKDSAELGCWFREPFWGRGYSGERALALAALGFEHLDFELLIVTHHPGNEQSERAITKYVNRLGGRREGVMRNAGVESIEHGGGVDLVRYSVCQAEYHAAAPEQAVAFSDADGESWP
ncbi:GCN5-related N-acetyltransferase [halophilic archaeon DL31]|jgi:RimJ/RimL family protein N-acetyltransferase|nr:GCN5-related N-acetyltransferase [halophilic archaeon DL31]